MGQMFQGPKMPALPVTPPPPTLADANAAAQSQADALAKRKGRASTLLTGDRSQRGDQDAPREVTEC